jgi:hypothetical protein
MKKNRKAKKNEKKKGAGKKKNLNLAKKKPIKISTESSDWSTTPIEILLFAIIGRSRDGPLGS